MRRASQAFNATRVGRRSGKEIFGRGCVATPRRYQFGQTQTQTQTQTQVRVRLEQAFLWIAVGAGAGFWIDRAQKSGSHFATLCLPVWRLIHG